MANGYTQAMSARTQLGLVCLVASAAACAAPRAPHAAPTQTAVAIEEPPPIAAPAKAELATIRLEGVDHPDALCVGADHSVFIRNEVYVDDPLADRREVVTRYRADGSVAWEHRYKPRIISHALQMAPLTDGSVLVAYVEQLSATVVYPDSPIPTIDEESVAVVKRVGPDGDTVWATRRNVVRDWDPEVDALVASKDGRFAAADNKGSVTTFGADGTKRADVPFVHELGGLVALDDGSFVAWSNPPEAEANPMHFLWVDHEGAVRHRFTADGNLSLPLDRPLVVGEEGARIVALAFCQGELTFGPDDPVLEAPPTAPNGAEVCLWRYDAKGKVVAARRHAVGDDDTIDGFASAPDGTLWFVLAGTVYTCDQKLSCARHAVSRDKPDGLLSDPQGGVWTYAHENGQLDLRQVAGNAP